jgi:hypothetical protein
MDWLFDHWWIVMLVCVVTVLVFRYVAYDGDIRCMVVECRIVKH